MSLPAVTFVAESIAESLLRKTTVYRYHPPVSMKETIVEGIKQHLNTDLTEYDVIEIKIDVVMKQYNRPDKKFWYEGETKNDDTKNTGI